MITKCSCGWHTRMQTPDGRITAIACSVCLAEACLRLGQSIHLHQMEPWRSALEGKGLIASLKGAIAHNESPC